MSLKKSFLEASPVNLPLCFIGQHWAYLHLKGTYHIYLRYWDLSKVGIELSSHGIRTGPSLHPFEQTRDFGIKVKEKLAVPTTV